MRQIFHCSPSYCSEPIEFTISSRITVPILCLVGIAEPFGHLIGGENFARGQFVKRAFPRKVVMSRFKAFREIKFPKLVVPESVLNVARDPHTMRRHGVCPDRRHQSFGGRNSFRYRKGFQNGHGSARCAPGMNEREEFTVRCTEE